MRKQIGLLQLMLIAFTAAYEYNDDISTTCGGVLRTQSGTISYKRFTPYDPNERCAWTLHFPNATLYYVTVESGDYSNIVMSNFSVSGKDPHHFVPPSAGSTWFLNTNLMVVIFQTQPANNTDNRIGFFLRYSVNGANSDQKANPNSEDFVVSANGGHIKYPSNRATYGAYDLSTFVITPVFDESNNPKTTQIIYIRNVLEEWYDSVTVYRYDRNLQPRWVETGIVPGIVDSELILGHDIIMLVFRSDSEVENSGFHLYCRAI